MAKEAKKEGSNKEITTKRKVKRSKKRKGKLKRTRRKKKYSETGNEIGRRRR